MALERHSLLNEFPDHHHTIRHLKMHNAHFAKLFDEYDELDHEVYRIESGEEARADDYLEQRKLRRLQLKDSLLAMVKKEEASQ
ncbi:DUF465 domain-containing protein [Aliiglaciecola sp. CAU 1673]|uniref:YdcH family protein n=1 Tax=Aliiglaciecola sp. CAU 1673 TaxID=3032595 RepID=UPI0023DB53B5|nr:DUF465 domain-containing protein [Aliiglaciecola sp. CAU 1673]MDF2180180.1 DUF465 domain-containing protein [Aliiglaciecola sp. CAU 1673]